MIKKENEAMSMEKGLTETGATEPSTVHRLTALERETVIRFDDSGDRAIVFTANKSLISALPKKGYTLVASGKQDATFECPKRCISFRTVSEPGSRPKRVMSEEHKRKLAEARKNRKQQRTAALLEQ
jgi:hypothetical protein